MPELTGGSRSSTPTTSGGTPRSGRGGAGGAVTRPISTPTPAPSPNMRRFCQLTDAQRAAEAMAERPRSHRGHRNVGKEGGHSTPTRRGIGDHHRITPDDTLSPRSTPTVSPRGTPGRRHQHHVITERNAWGTPDITPGETPIDHRTPDGTLDHSLDSLQQKVSDHNRSRSPEIVPCTPGTPNKRTCAGDPSTNKVHTPKKTPSKLSLAKSKGDSKKSKACKNNSMGCFGCISRKGRRCPMTFTTFLLCHLFCINL